MTFFRTFLRNESGATAIEYAFLAALIAMAILLIVEQVGVNSGKTFNNISKGMDKAGR